VISLRLEAELDNKVRRAAARRGETVSEFIRLAAEARADETLGESARDRLEDVIGAVHGGGRRARRTGDAFRETLARKTRR
jgi:hypothetical protein